MQNRPTILLTGSEGFIGGTFKVLFQKMKRFEVFTPSKAELNLTSHKDVREYLKAHDPKYVLHTATSEAVNKKYAENVCEENLRMFFNLQRSISPKTRLVNFTSGSDFSREAWRGGMSEDYFDTDVPIDSHSFSKYTITKFIRGTKSTNLINLRLFGVFGVLEDYRFKFITNTIAKVLYDLPIIINQNAVFDYLYVNDLFTIVMKLITSNLNNVEYNVVPSKSIELVRIASIIRDISGKNLPINVLNNRLGSTYTGSNLRLISEIPSISFTPYETSIFETYQEMKRHMKDINEEELKQDLFLRFVTKGKGRT